MKVTFISLLFISFSFSLFGQFTNAAIEKKPVDYSAFARWPEIQAPEVSNNGRYIQYTVWTEEDGSTLVVKDVDNVWQMQVSRAMNAVITSDSRYVIFSLSSDTIGIIKNGGPGIEYITGAESFKVPKFGDGRWLAVRLNTNEKKLILRNLGNGAQKIFTDVNDYFFSPFGSVLLLKKRIRRENAEVNQLDWINLPSGDCFTIAGGFLDAVGFTFDAANRQVAFKARIVNSSSEEMILKLFSLNMDTAVTIVDRAKSGLNSRMTIGSSEMHFSQDGSKLYFPLKISRSADHDAIGEKGKAQIWSYSDDYLLSQKKIEQKYDIYRNLTAVVSTSKSNVVLLDSTNDDWTSLEFAAHGNGEFVLVKTKSDFSQEDWRESVRPSLYLVSTKDGKRTSVISGRLVANTDHLSPSGRFVVWYDRELRNYFSYNTESKITTNITRQIRLPIYDDEDDHPRFPMPFGIATWLENDESILIYDRYDIWRVDPNGIKHPELVTGGYGKEHKTILRLPKRVNDNLDDEVIRSNDELILVAFNRENKHNGFFKLTMKEPYKLMKQTMGPYIYHYCFEPYPSFNLADDKFLKARNAEVYVVTKCNVSEFPNLYATSDFRHFKQLSDLRPEKAYNWLTSELVHWQTYDGIMAEGILYKPENFDSTRRYPVIFYFYEKDANGLNNYLKPKWSDGQINIPYFVSNGYLVFDPNIYYKPGEPGQSVFNSVVSAARVLSKKDYVDSTRLGLQGHSFGGYEVNFLITQTSQFKAAASAAGLSDLVSMYGSLRSYWGNSSQNMLETDQIRLGRTLFDKPDLYIKNSPVFRADKVTTPLLMMHNEQDGAVPFFQSIEYFTALRRLRKKVWLLQYDRGSHQVEGETNLIDYTTRLKQFFDYYLKGAAAPEWIDGGI